MSTAISLYPAIDLAPLQALADQAKAYTRRSKAANTWRADADD